MPSQRTDNRKDGRCAKDNSQNAINNVGPCLLPNFAPDLRIEVLNNRPPESRRATTRVKLPKRFNSLGPSQISHRDDGDEAQSEQQSKPLPERMGLFI